MRLRDLRDPSVGIWGFGREGRSTYRRLRAAFPDKPLTILNDAPLPDVVAGELAADPVEIVTGPSAVAERLGDTARRLDVIVKSPGIGLYRPGVAAARALGTRITSATNIWFAENPEARTVAVTGTKGKSTTASLAAHLLRHAGRTVALAGNIGTAVLDLPPDAGARDTIVVLELSSYQIADLAHAPTVAVLLNLYPEHIDWHLTTEAYYRDKLRLFRPGADQLIILNKQDPTTRRLTADWPAPIRYFNDPAGLHVRDDGVYDGGRRLCAADAVPLPGRHNRLNLCAALAAARACGVEPDACLPGLATFRSLPHRLQIVGERDGVTYVDDSISTTPESAMAAVAAFAGRPITLLLGGYDRRQDYAELSRVLPRAGVVAVVTLPDNGPAVAAAVRAVGTTAPPVFEAADLAEAVAIARRWTPPGGVVLLSPAAPSYGRFANFEERGRRFAELAGFPVPT